MNQIVREHIEHLKSALLSLPATGAKGFEGLIGTTLCAISGVPFRLAKSGSQFGIDGDSAYEGDTICFEGKLYADDVPKEKVLSKIAELSINDPETDIWVLGATSQIGTQLAKNARKLGAKNGIIVLILDWSKTDLPPFAVALAMGGARVEEFLKTNIEEDKTLQEALAALEATRNSEDYAPHADRIRAQCNEPAAGMPLAQRANTNWLGDAFSNRKRAKTKLGQPLSPGDTTDTANVLQRQGLIDKMSPFITTDPDKTVVFVLGGEGHGKSWIVAQSWLALAHKPLMIFMVPDDFAEVAGQNNIVNLLINQLVRQTGEVETETIRGRWRRRLNQWKTRTATDTPRIVVVIDGINQRPKSDWAKIIEDLGEELNQIGGRLIVTARTPYFMGRVKCRLSLCVAEIVVPEWTEPERDKILIAHGIKAMSLHHAVAKSLCNPRLLGIALDLLDKADVANFEELSVSRLLFEHIRMSERDAPVPQPAPEFARQLQKHAQEIMSRRKAEQQDDLNVFENDMGAVADGRFFLPVDGDPTRYTLKDDGLTLALGFSVIDRLRIAQRNDRCLDAELEAILEPIAALDDTADVILAALTVSTADEEGYERNIAASLAKGFTALQNPDQAKFPAFAGLVKKRPQGFMDAAGSLSLDGGRHPNFDWLQDSLIVAGRNSCSWGEITDQVHDWLSAYSLSPDRGSFSHFARASQGKGQEEREKNRKKIDEKLQAMSATEQTILNDLPNKDGDLSRRSRLALLLLAGKPLAPFAKSLLNWCFSFSLNSDHFAPHKEFIHLVRLNKVDWPQTRATLLDFSATLRAADVSRTGKWALVNILRATGHSEDGREADALAEELTNDIPIREAWRRIENYCATDPCNPASQQPENITRTAEQYAAIDVSKLRQGKQQTSEDHFFVMARPGVARFKPEVAVQKHREFAANVLCRTGLPLRQGLFELHQHNALLTIKNACELVRKRNEAKRTATATGLSEQDAWVDSQYHLLLAFPFFTAWEQAKILLSSEQDENILLTLMAQLKPLNEKEFERLLEAASDENNERSQYLLLEIAKCTSVKLSANARARVMALFQSESSRVRTAVLGIAAQSGDEQLLGIIARSDWKVDDIKTENGFEFWFGSVALLEAAASRLISPADILERISPCLYGRAAVLLDTTSVREIARRIDASINQVFGLDADLVAPDIEIRVHSTVHYEPSLVSLAERPSETRDIREAMRRISESDEDFYQRQKRNHDAYLQFKANLAQAKADILLDHLSLAEFAAVVALSEELADRWYGLFMSIVDTKLPAVHNLALLLAHAFGTKDPAKAIQLFLRVRDSNPLVRFTFGSAGIQLGAIATWACGRNAVLDELRFSRLDRANTDHELFLEVLAALLNGQRELLAAYVETKLRSEEPAEIARGIMATGFSDQSEFNDEILNGYEGSAGLIGSALKAAKYAYDRNVWARYWYAKMSETDENIDFWRYSMLFSKIVDGRFSVWHSDYEQKGNSMRLFWPSVESNLENNFTRRSSHRNKKLFGEDAPAPIFIRATEHS